MSLKKSPSAFEEETTLTGPLLGDGEQNFLNQPLNGKPVMGAMVSL